jgi:hypothetical protein
MGKLSIFAFVALSLMTPFAGAFEIKNPRVTHGPMGATRCDFQRKPQAPLEQFLPGDYLFISFDLDGLLFDPATGKATYQTILKLYNAKNEEIFDKKTDNTVSPMLGGTRIPGDLHVIMGTKQEPGRYVVRLIVTDKLDNKGKALKYIDFPFELMPPNFGLVGVTAPAIGFPGQHYVASFALVNMKLDAKNNPNVAVVMKVLDEAGTLEMTKPINTFLPKDMPQDGGVNLAKENFVPMQFPIYLNRAGRFTVEIEATDLAANRKTKLRYKLTVIDIDNVIGR